MMYKKIRKFFLILIISFSWIFSGVPKIFNFPPIVQNAYAVTTAALAPGANAAKASSAGDNNGFETTPGNADGTDNNAYAVSSNTGTGSATDVCSTFNQSEDDAHDFFNFGIAPPAGSTINGIQVNTIAKWSTNTDTNQLCIELSWNGGTSWTSTANTTGDIQTTESADALGGSANTWGRTWTVSELNNTNFRVRVMIDPGNAITTAASLELLTVTVTYTLPSTFEQAAYRFFNNADSTNVGSVLAAQDTAATLVSPGGAFRLRTLLHIGDGQLSTSGQNFKLQFATRSGTCDTAFSGENYADVTGATAIAYKNNSPADGDNLTANASDPTHSGHTIVNQDYEEANNFTNTVAAIPAGQDGKWDFSLFDNAAPANTTYCFRIVKSDGSLLNTYSVIPQITTASLVYSVTITSSGAIAYGFVSLGNATSTVNHGYTQTAQNDGNTAEQLNVKSGNASGGTAWTLASVIGTNQFTHEFSTTTGSVWTTMPDSSTYVTAARSVAQSGTVNFDFRLTVPSATSDYQQKAITITVQAVAP